MKIMTVFGTRPEIIRLCLIVRQLDQHARQVLVHTGQNYDPRLSELFLEQLKVRPLDHHLGIQAQSFGAQAGAILGRVDELLVQEKPDRLLILGDTNSGLAALVAARRGIPVYHLEAGNRCFDRRVPEEVNRRIIDHSSDILLPYTERSAANLVREGISRDRVFVVGNPIKEVLDHFQPEIDGSTVLSALNLRRQQFFLVTIHRAENVDSADRLAQLFEGLRRLNREHNLPVIVSAHPRTADRLRNMPGVVATEGVRLHPPFGLFEFVQLEKQALAVVTDSGTVQEEACIFGIPSVTIRDVTERPETIECGGNVLVGADPERLCAAMRLALAQRGRWQAPPEYLRSNVAQTVAKILTGHRTQGQIY